MTISQFPGLFSKAMYGTQQAGLLEAAFDRLLSLELDRSQVNAQSMGEFATTLTCRQKTSFPSWMPEDFSCSH